MQCRESKVSDIRQHILTCRHASATKCCGSVRKPSTAHAGCGVPKASVAAATIEAAADLASTALRGAFFRVACKGRVCPTKAVDEREDSTIKDNLTNNMLKEVPVLLRKPILEFAASFY